MTTQEINAGQVKTPAETRSRYADVVWWIYCAGLFLVSIARNWRALIPNWNPLNPWDEANYIDSGSVVAHGQWPIFAQNPGCGVFFAPLYAITRSHENWIYASATIGHGIEALLIWLGVASVAWVLRDRVHPLLVFVPMAFADPHLRMTSNSSDSLFTAFSAFALAATIAYAQRLRLGSVLMAGLLLGISGLMRSDAVVLLPIASLLVLFTPNSRRWLATAVFLLGAVGVFGANLAVQYAHVHTLDPGLQHRSYNAFEQGQGVVYSDEHPADPYIWGQSESTRLYGTEEQNHWSIPTAISRNPGAYKARELHLLHRIASSVRGKRGLAGLLVLALWLLAVATFVRGRQYDGVVLCLWPLHLLVYFVTFFRSHYVLLDLSSFLVLTGIGAMWVVDAVRRRLPTVENRRIAVVAAILLFAAVFVASPRMVKRSAPDPDIYAPAAEALRNATPDGGVVAVPSMMVAYLADRPSVSFFTDPHGEQTPSTARDWLTANHVTAIVLDGQTQTAEPAVYRSMLAQGWTTVYQRDELILAPPARHRVS